MYLGLDLGTSGLRALLVDGTGAPLGSAEAHYDVSHPHPGWSEQDPKDWVSACETAISQLKSQHGAAFAQLSGIGISGHMHGAVLLGEADEILRPCILWNDTRCADEAAILDATPGVRELSGNIVFPGFTAPKLLWVEAHEPDIFQQVKKVLLPKDYLRLWLTGAHVGDMSDMAGSSWLDVGARDWSETLLEHGHMRRDQMADLVEGSESSGILRGALQEAWGVGEVVIAGGGGDNAVAACGVGCFKEGQGFVSLGTSGVLLAAKDSFAPDPATAVHTFCHAVPGRWYQMGVILAATDALNWLSKRLKASPAELSALVTAVDGPGQALFLPYLSGERTPHNDSEMRGAFVGLDVGGGDAALVQAVMEGVCFALRDCLEALRATGTELEQVLAIGGGTKSRVWVEMLATVLGLPLALPKDGEFGAALGAARLAMVATGAEIEAVMTQPEIGEVVAPKAELREAYEAAYQRYRRLYPAIKGALA
ncbi:Xylulose kinase [Pelagimonas phthalicica]|uniref:Xylulose kinase n=1 Tax=Pelagimonas phthalicica TaxID=1037362 RepID=A0A238JHF9_9RHOB|nr:xylulokinase [Pelagimonas phthalicica]TDS92331.1 xylulokinase [Pelagimonas phthalicica]SMX29392.1 Xylulose kinase [Pelagimonas phthalicica]